MAAARKKIGVFLSNQKEWTGGFYYTINLIHVLQFLPDSIKPHIVFFYSDETPVVPKEIQEINYPYTSFLPLYVKIDILKRIANKLKRLLAPESRMYGYYASDTVDFIYPCFDSSMEDVFSFIKVIPKIYWIPDFQDKYYPEFFSVEELTNREKLKHQLIEKNVPLVFSSYNASHDFRKFYPQGNNKIKVLRFASILPDLRNIYLPILLEKYCATEPYFISPNQFWPHKNHTIVIDAVALLVKRDFPVNVFFTGKESNTQAPEYAHTMKKKVSDLGLEKYVHFLGFIDRKEQLMLMKAARAVIQPSLFEGWSTVVEDTKAVGGRLIVSDLPIHREQCVENVSFFDPLNAAELADRMVAEIQHPSVIKEINYTKHIEAFAQDFLNLNN